MTSIGLPACGLPSAEFQSGNRVGHGNQRGIAFLPEHRFTKDKEPVGTLPLLSVWYVSPIVTRTPCDTYLKRRLSWLRTSRLMIWIRSRNTDVGEEALSLCVQEKCLGEHWNAKTMKLLRIRENYIMIIFKIHLPLLG
jgi:hypothetical protein